MENNQSNREQIDKICLIEIQGLIDSLFVPEIESGFERPVEISDYKHYLSTCNEKFELILALISNSPSLFGVNDKLKQKCICSAIILYGEHSSSNLWTTEKSLKVSKLIVEKLINIFGFFNVTDVLVSDNGAIFDKILKELRPNLLKDSWKNNAAAVVCYFWVLKLVKSPHLAEHLNSVLPTALILIDDFVSENRILGLKCMGHIINNVGRTHLCWYAQDEVILKALEPLVLFKDEELIEPLISVLMDLLKKKFPQVTNIELLMNDFDPIINNILHNMMLEQRLKLRMTYSKMLPVIISARGLGILMHSVALFKVIDEYVLEPTSSAEGLEVYLGLQHKHFPDLCEKKLGEIIALLQNLCPGMMEQKQIEISKQHYLPYLQTIFNN